MLMVALLVAWCIWIARDRRSFLSLWFQPDIDQVEHKEPEEEAGDGKLSIPDWMLSTASQQH